MKTKKAESEKLRAESKEPVSFGLSALSSK